MPSPGSVSPSLRAWDVGEKFYISLDCGGEMLPYEICTGWGWSLRHCTWSFPMPGHPKYQLWGPAQSGAAEGPGGAAAALCHPQGGKPDAGEAQRVRVLSNPARTLCLSALPAHPVDVAQESHVAVTKSHHPERGKPYLQLPGTPL